MSGVKVSEYSFKRKNQTVTLASKSAVKIDGESIQVDPLLLFQRLSLAGKTDFPLPTFPLPYLRQLN